MIDENHKSDSPTLQNMQNEFKCFTYNSNTIPCQLCQKNFLDNDTEKIWYLLNCFHCICRGCLIKHVQTNYIREKGQVKCPLPLCGSLLIEDDYYVKKNRF